jgi:hypothetical protein
VRGLAAVLLIACENEMERAQQALDDNSYSVATTMADGTKHVPDEAKSLPDNIAAISDMKY